MNKNGEEAIGSWKFKQEGEITDNFVSLLMKRIPSINITWMSIC